MSGEDSEMRLCEAKSLSMTTLRMTAEAKVCTRSSVFLAHYEDRWMQPTCFCLHRLQTTVNIVDFIMMQTTKHCVCKSAYLVPVPSQDKLVDCGRKGIRRKNGEDGGGGSINFLHGLASSWIVGASAFVIFPLHQKTQKMACLVSHRGQPHVLLSSQITNYTVVQKTDSCYISK